MIESSRPLALPKWRRMVLLIGILLSFALLFAVAAYTQLVPNPKLQKEVKSKFETNRRLVAMRGKILDRKGIRLAASEMLVDFEANPRAIFKHKAKLGAKKTNKALVAYERKLDQAIEILSLDKTKIHEQLMLKKNKGKLVLRTKVNQQLADQVKALGVPGIFYVDKPYRQYTCHEACGHLIGRKGKAKPSQEALAVAKQSGRRLDRLPGYLGIERSFNAQLEGQDGYHKFRSAGKIKLEDIEAIARPQNGNDVVLSIDSKIQHITYEALQKAVDEKAHAKSGAAIVLDAKTGEILSLAVYPSYDPVKGPKVESDFSNFAMNAVFDPGSTMKSFSVAAALEFGLVTPETKVDTSPGYLKFGQFTITDHHKKYGVISVKEVIQKSSNIGSSKIAFELGAESLWKAYKELEFGQKTNIQFPGEKNGRVNHYKQWTPVDLAAHSYGHGVDVTLPQLARAYTVFANEGTLLPITLKRIKRAPVGKPVFSKKTANQMRQILQSVVTEEGTAPEARIEGYSVAGKTGTAYILDISKGEYDHDKYISSFVGMAPASDPKFIMAVMIQEPDIAGKQHYGGKVAGPVFSEVVLKTLKHRDIAPDMPTKPSVALQQSTKPKQTSRRGHRARG